MSPGSDVDGEWRRGSHRVGFSGVAREIGFESRDSRDLRPATRVSRGGRRPEVQRRSFTYQLLGSTVAGMIPRRRDLHRCRNPAPCFVLWTQQSNAGERR